MRLLGLLMIWLSLSGRGEAGREDDVRVRRQEVRAAIDILSVVEAHGVEFEVLFVEQSGPTAAPELGRVGQERVGGAGLRKLKHRL